MCVCVCERERERERESVCVCARARACVCARARACVCTRACASDGVFFRKNHSSVFFLERQDRSVEAGFTRGAVFACYTGKLGKHAHS